LEKQGINEAVTVLTDMGFVTADYLKFSDDIEKIYFSEEKLNAVYEYLKEEDGSFLCDVNEQGEVIVDLKMRTSVKGLYAAGDVRVDAAKQVVCAAGDGATAAVNIIEYIG
jgi:thioredoxin reductase